MRPLVFGEPVVPTLEKRDYSRLIGTELWRNFEAEGRAGADCRGSGFRPVASFLSVSVPPCAAFPLEIERGIHARKVAAHFGHGSWRILRSAGVISLKDSRIDDPFLPFLSAWYNKSLNAEPNLGFRRNRENPLPRDSCKWKDGLLFE